MISSARQVDEIKGRCKVRVFSGADVADMVAENRKKAKKSKHGAVCTVYHAGSVANKYGYPATSQIVMVGAMADGRAVVKLSALPANKITYGGAVAALLGEQARPMCDNRYSAAKTEAAKEYVRRCVCEMVTDAANLWGE